MKTLTFNPLENLPVDNRRFIERCMSKGLCAVRPDAQLPVPQPSLQGSRPIRRELDARIQSRPRLNEGQMQTLFAVLRPLAARTFGVEETCFDKKRIAGQFHDPWLCLLLLAKEFSGLTNDELGLSLHRRGTCVSHALRNAEYRLVNDHRFADRFTALHARAESGLQAMGLIPQQLTDPLTLNHEHPHHH
jgi:hypothetical protein